MIARITNIAPTGSWTGQHGLMYSFDVEFDDGMAGQANSKSPNPPYQIGDDMDYQQAGVTPKGQNKLKIQKPEDAGGHPARPPQRQAPAPRPAAQQPRTAPAMALGASIHPATVGMGVKEALGLHSQVLRPEDLAVAIQDPIWWGKVEVTASRIIKISLALEKGQRATVPPAPRPAPPPPAPVADEDVPF